MSSNWSSTGILSGAAVVLLFMFFMQHKSVIETFVSLPLTKRITHELHLPATATRCAKTVPVSQACFQPTQAELCATQSACLVPQASVEPPPEEPCCQRRRRPRMRARRKSVRFSEPLEMAGKSPAIDDLTFNAIEDMFGFSSGSTQGIVDTKQEMQLPRSIRRRAPVIDLNDTKMPKCLEVACDQTPALPLTDMRSCVQNQLDCGDKMHYDEALALGREPVLHERVTLAPVRSRLRAQGDPLRGDLPIAPVAPMAHDTCSLIMFRPSVAPSLDLRPGYFTPASTSSACALDRLIET